jgi:BirA family biotin operon repressor/biotin-[acetyl-CoA-carboxylase] ligase
LNRQRPSQVADFLAREEHFALVPSTNDVVRVWLASGTAEVCLAIADAQSAGRGRRDRTWTAPAGRALLLSLGFRPTWLVAERTWQLGASVSLAMAEAAERVAGLADRTIRLKWPNDLVVETNGPTAIRKIAGVLGESVGLGGVDPQVVVGLGLNTDWIAADFPEALATSMTSLREVSGGRAIDHATLREAFLTRLEARVVALRAGRFDADDWGDRQLTTGRDVELVAPDGASEAVRAVGVNPSTGALLVQGRSGDPAVRSVFVGEIGRVRLRTIDIACNSPVGV